MNSFKKILNNRFFFPVLVILWGIVSVLFFEKLPANNGLGWDGYRYALIVQELLLSSAVDNYTVLRIFPPSLVHSILKLLYVEPSAAHIINSFHVLNTLSIAVAAFFFKKCLAQFSISPENQLIAFVLLLFNYAIANFTYYYPVMTDSVAFCVSAIMLYCYLRKQTLNLFLLTIIGAFTWPSLLLQGVLLILFPYENNYPVKTFNSRIRFGFSLFSCVYLFVLIAYFVFYSGQDNEVYGVPKIDQNLIFTSAIGILLLFYFLPQLLFNKAFYYPVSWFTKRTLISLVTCAVIVVIIFVAKDWLNFSNRQSHYYNLQHQLTTSMVFGMAKPLISVVSHSTYFGSLFVLLIVLWNPFTKEVHALGKGWAFFLFINLFLFGLKTESRAIINVVPWLVFGLTIVLNQKPRNKWFSLAIVCFNILSTKMWLSVNYGSANGGLDNRGAALFPDQGFFLNFGNRMSEKMWLIQLGLTIAFGIIIYFLIKTNEYGKPRKLR
jgi:hypothetical protein